MIDESEFNHNPTDSRDIDGGKLASFEKAKEAVENGEGDGLGFAVTRHDPFLVLEIINGLQGDELAPTVEAILDALGAENVIVVSPIGGQGFVFGRGNPQISPAVIRRCDLRIVASRAKLDDVRALRVDTDDPDLDESLAGWVRVRVGKFETRMMKIV